MGKKNRKSQEQAQGEVTPAVAEQPVVQDVAVAEVPAIEQPVAAEQPAMEPVAAADPVVEKQVRLVTTYVMGEADYLALKDAIEALTKLGQGETDLSAAIKALTDAKKRTFKASVPAEKPPKTFGAPQSEKVKAFIAKHAPEFAVRTSGDDRKVLSETDADDKGCTIYTKACGSWVTARLQLCHEMAHGLSVRYHHPKGWIEFHNAAWRAKFMELVGAGVTEGLFTENGKDLGTLAVRAADTSKLSAPVILDASDVEFAL